MGTNKPGNSAELTAEQIDEMIDTMRKFMGVALNLALDMTKLTLYQKYGIDIGGQEGEKSETANLS